MKVEIDWGKDGFGTHGDDVTADVRLNAQPLSAEYGRDQTTALAPTVAGRGALTLDNREGAYTPRNPGSILAGNLKPARPVRVTRTIAGTTYGLFVGHTDDEPITPDLDTQHVSLTLLDYLADFRGQQINTPLYRSITSGQAIGYVLDACGWDPDLRDLDPGATVIPWWWEDGTDALDALEKIIRSEGPPAMLTVGPDGEIVFRGRHHRLTRSASTTSQGTWRAVAGVEPVMGRGFTYDEAWRNIINTGNISVDVRLPVDSQPVFTSESDITISLSAGEQRVISVQSSDPFYDAITPEAGTDYTLLAGSASFRLIRDSGLSTAIEISAGASGVTLSGLQLRANPVPVAYTVQVTASDQTSIDEHGRRSFPHDLPWCSPADAQAVLNTAVSLRAQPLPIVTARFQIGPNGLATRAAAVLARNLSDRVHIEEERTYTDRDFYIEHIRHDLNSTFNHEVTFGCEAAPEPATNVFILGSATRGVLGTNRLGSRALDQPDRIFILGSPTNGVLGTSILAT